MLAEHGTVRAAQQRRGLGATGRTRGDCRSRQSSGFLSGSLKFRRRVLEGGATQMTVSRRFAAILAADVAGYFRLMGWDEEFTLERLKAHRRES